MLIFENRKSTSAGEIDQQKDDDTGTHSRCKIKLNEKSEVIA